MIDKNKPLEAYSKEELLEALSSGRERESYPLLKLVYEENAKSNRYYSYFDDFQKMIDAKSSFMRMRGFGLCASLVQWDIEDKVDKHLDEMLILLEDEKPITVRVVLSCLMDILGSKPQLALCIKENLGRIDCRKYKDSMVPLIQKDVKKVNEVIANILEYPLSVEGNKEGQRK